MTHVARGGTILVMADTMPTADSSPDRAGSDWTAAWPTGRHSPFTPEGEIEQFGKFASGVKRLRGWHCVSGRLVAFIVLAVIVLLPVTATVLAVILRK